MPASPNPQPQCYMEHMTEVLSACFIVFPANKMPHVKTSHSPWPTSALLPHHLVLLTHPYCPSSLPPSTHNCKDNDRMSSSFNQFPKVRDCLHWLLGMEIWVEGLVWLFCLDVNTIPLYGGPSVQHSSKTMRLLTQFLSLLRGTKSPFSWDVSSISPWSNLCKCKPVLISGPHTGPENQVPYLTWRRAWVHDHVDFSNQFPWHTDASMLPPKHGNRRNLHREILG